MGAVLARSTPIIGQCAAILAGLALFASRPPENGRILLIPLGRGDAGAAVRMALDHGASLVANGPIRGSVIVEARRADLAAAARSAGVLMLAAPSSGCGGPA